MISASKIFNSLFDNLASRQREVVLGRFGLDKSGQPQTLAALGSKYGVTRERVRQIEVAALALFKKEILSSDDFSAIINKSKNVLKDAGGVVRKEVLLDALKSVVDGLTENHLALIIEATKSFSFHAEDKHHYGFYYLDKNSLKIATNFIGQWTAFLHTKKDHVLRGKYQEFLSAFLDKKDISESVAENYLSITKKIHGNPFGDKGLSDWSEIKPRTIRDRAYLVLKKKGEPLHFRFITNTINEIGFDARKASAPTVHNELIKDNRFVLVGRGIYALAEHGYEPGTAREIIQKVLKKYGSMKPREIILAIQKERFFKPNTILVNLQNKSYFERLPNGNYQVRES